MKKFFTPLLLFVGMLLFNACENQETTQLANQIPQDVLNALESAGYNVFDQLPISFENGYLVEGDIYIQSYEIDNLQPARRLPVEEQYSTNNLVTVNGSRNITIYAATSGKSGFSPGMIAGLDLAIARYNNENLGITFQRITNSNNADITLSRLSKGDERRGILGSSGFPSSAGDPYPVIKMSGILESTYGLSTAGIGTIIAHEMGHCIGFRHTDYFDRSISCGGAKTNEGDAGIGANLIPGTPAGATLADKSWMLSCTDGGDRPFNNDDKTALDYLY